MTTHVTVTGAGMVPIPTQRKPRVDPTDINIAELHECVTANELVSYGVLGLTGIGAGEQSINDGDTMYGRQAAANPPQGLLSKGHPLSAKSVSQCAALAWQLRRQAGPWQADEATVALQSNFGLGGATFITFYKKICS